MNLSNGSGDMERIQNSTVNPMTLMCDLNLESPLSLHIAESCVLHTVSLRRTFE